MIKHKYDAWHYAQAGKEDSYLKAIEEIERDTKLDTLMSFYFPVLIGIFVAIMLTIYFVTNIGT